MSGCGSLTWVFCCWASLDLNSQVLVLVSDWVTGTQGCWMCLSSVVSSSFGLVWWHQHRKALFVKMADRNLSSSSFSWTHFVFRCSRFISLPRTVSDAAHVTWGLLTSRSLLAAVRASADIKTSEGLSALKPNWQQLKANISIWQIHQTSSHLTIHQTSNIHPSI